MAKRRMFSTEFLQSDNFSDLPFSCQVLYFNLMGSADDDGFISGPRRIMRGCNCAEEDMKYLVKAGFIFVFDSGIAVIRHWLIHNHIRKDRHTETVHAEEKAQLELKNGIYAWHEGAKKKQNTGTEKVQPELKNCAYECREDREEKATKIVEKTVPELKKDAHGWRKGEEKNRNVCTEKVKSALKNNESACSENDEEKLMEDAEKIKPALIKNFFSWLEEGEEQHIEPVEKTKSEHFCFQKEREEIGEFPKMIQPAKDRFQLN